MTSVWRSVASTMLLAAPELGTKNHICLCFFDPLKFSVDSIIARPLFAIVSGDSLLKREVYWMSLLLGTWSILTSIH
jgi:hypothetical protein